MNKDFVNEIENLIHKIKNQLSGASRVLLDQYDAKSIIDFLSMLRGSLEDE